MLLYKRFWDDFCSWYLEIIKPSGSGKKKIDAATYDTTLEFFDILLHMLHPFMPFITEELWQNIYERKEGESIMVSGVPGTGSYNRKELEQFARLQELVVSIRGLRQKKQIPGKTALTLYIKGSFAENLYGIAKRMGGLEAVVSVKETPREGNVYSFMIGTTEFFIPLGELLDTKEERSKLKGELEYYRNFLAGVEKKLNNPNFVQRAPEQVVATEQKKRSDALAKIAALEQQLSSLQ
jgi:valyl-tRNA synthetase